MSTALAHDRVAHLNPLLALRFGNKKVAQ